MKATLYHAWGLKQFRKSFAVHLQLYRVIPRRCISLWFCLHKTQAERFDLTFLAKHGHQGNTSLV